MCLVTVMHSLKIYWKNGGFIQGFVFYFFPTVIFQLKQKQTSISGNSVYFLAGSKIIVSLIYLSDTVLFVFYPKLQRNTPGANILRDFIYILLRCFLNKSSFWKKKVFILRESNAIHLKDTAFLFTFSAFYF